MRRLIFVLGDSRTGTMTLHRFFQAVGYRSIHYAVEEASQKMPIHLNHDANWGKFNDFIDHSGYECFSDYPTRSFFRELYKAYPDAAFILTERRDLATWQRSMSQFFSTLGQEIDLDQLSKSYLETNDGILKLFGSGDRRFLRLNIDDDAATNSTLLRAFIGDASPFELGWENKSALYHEDIFSKRGLLFNSPAEDFVAYVEAICAPHQATLSEYGWIYPINDRDHFLRYQFGLQEWQSERANRALTKLEGARDALAAHGSRYHRFIVPEKSVLYREFLPRIFENRPEASQRPATIVAAQAPEIAVYLLDYLKDLKGYGFISSRLDDRLTALGSYFAYFYVMALVNRQLAKTVKGDILQIPLNQLTAGLRSSTGTLKALLSTSQQRDLHRIWGELDGPSGSDELSLTLPATLNTCREIPVSDALSRHVGKDEKWTAFENSARKLPTGVIISSGLDPVAIDLFAQHFRDSVFIQADWFAPSEIFEEQRPDVVIHISRERDISIEA